MRIENQRLITLADEKADEISLSPAFLLLVDNTDIANLRLYLSHILITSLTLIYGCKDSQIIPITQV